MLHGVVKEVLRAHLVEVKKQYERDLIEGVGRVVLPFALDRKYPNASTEWGWQFVFPAKRICRDPEWGPPAGFSCTSRRCRSRWLQPRGKWG
jgi:hypothetical protein